MRAWIMTGLLLMTTTAAMSDNKNDKEWALIVICNL